MTKTLTLYSASELKEINPSAFKKAHEKWNSNDEIFWMDETIESLFALIKSGGLHLRDWKLGPYAYESYIKIDWPDDIKDLSGQRAMAWLENNLLGQFRITKNTKDYLKYNRSYVDKSLRPYSIGKIEPCPFTGYYADEDFIESLLNDIKAGCTLGEAYNNLANKCAELIYAEWEAQCSEEYFIDHAEANEYQFTLDGQLVW